MHMQSVTQMPVSVHEFKAHLSRYLSEVRAGQAIEITSHRKVIARVTPAPDTGASGIERLVAEGRAQWRGGKPLGSSIRLSEHGKPISQMILEDRD